LQGNQPPHPTNWQIRLLHHVQSISPLNGFVILHGRLINADEVFSTHNDAHLPPEIRKTSLFYESCYCKDFNNERAFGYLDTLPERYGIKTAPDETLNWSVNWHREYLSGSFRAHAGNQLSARIRKLAREQYAGMTAEFILIGRQRQHSSSIAATLNSSAMSAWGLWRPQCRRRHPRVRLSSA
jgi:hypothetical protein